MIEDGFELIKTFDTIIAGKFPLRLYRSRFSPTDLDKPIEEYRYHFGFPEKLVKPAALLLETTPYWGNKHWKEEDGFWIWWLTVTSNAKNGPPYKALNRRLDYMLHAYNNVVRFLRKSCKK